MGGRNAIGRAAALGAVLIAVVGAIVIFVGRGADTYKVQAVFQNASQIVKGNLVQIAGEPVGEVEEIELTRDGRAILSLKIEEDYAPLRRGTEVTVRATSLSGVANRYLDLRLAPEGAPEIPDGGRIEQSDTTTAVDLDQIFNIFRENERKAVRQVVRGFATQYAGRAEEANRGWAYLNPSIAATTRLFNEINRDSGDLEDFVVESSQLVTDLADRREDLAGLVSNLADTTGALGNQRESLKEAIRRLPDFMRRSNTTFVNLRSVLDDLDPLVAESRPVLRRLRPFLGELRPFARDAVPTLRDLSDIIRRPGRANDLIEATRLNVPLRDIAVRGGRFNGERRRGAFPETVDALDTATPELAFARPYAVDLTGWFDDFGHSGLYDAYGGASRVAPHIAAFQNLNGVLSPILGNENRLEAFDELITTGQNNRCPGAAEGGRDPSTPWRPTPDFNCDPSQIPPGG